MTSRFTGTFLSTSRLSNSVPVGRVRVCLITPGQPSTNPRLVKEADALADAGYDVRVICGYWAPWALDADRQMLQRRRWSPIYVGGLRTTELRYLWTRACHRASRAVLNLRSTATMIQERAVARVVPELRRAALRVPADLYIAHNLGALPAAIAAAQAHGARVAFDAEDFHSAERHHGAPPMPMDDAVEAIERRYLGRCDYTTAASPGIADAYASKYAIPRPRPILNVFPRAHRPDVFRQPAPDPGPMRLYWFSQTIGPDRGLEDAVDAMGALRHVAMELHLRGVWQPGFQDRIAGRCRSLGVDPARIVAHPPAPPDEMVRLAAPYDIGLALEQPVSRNREICLTNKIFTYLLAGNAVVGTATEGQAPVLARLRDAGFAYRPGDVPALAAGLRQWWTDHRRLEAARRAAWLWGEREYNWDVEQQKFLTVVASVLERPMRAAMTAS